MWEALSFYNGLYHYQFHCCNRSKIYCFILLVNAIIHIFCQSALSSLSKIGLAPSKTYAFKHMFSHRNRKLIPPNETALLYYRWLIWLCSQLFLVTPQINQLVARFGLTPSFAWISESPVFSFQNWQFHHQANRITRTSFIYKGKRYLVILL